MCVPAECVVDLLGPMLGYLTTAEALAKATRETPVGPEEPTT